MRSELPWLEPKSPWTRVGPTLLGLAIVGVGVGGAVRIVRAQDAVTVSPDNVVVSQAIPLKIEPKIANTDDQDEDKQDDEKSADSKLSDSDRQKLRKELDDLQGQRDKLDGRIDALRNKLGEGREIRINGRRVVAPRARVFTFDGNAWKDFTPEQRRKMEQDMKRAGEEMRRAGEEMRRSQKDLKFNFVMPPMPPMGDLPAVSKVAPFVFQWRNGDKNGKDFEANGKEYEAQMREFEARMQKWEAEFNRRMERWSREFQSRMNEKFGSENGTPRRPRKPEGPSIEPKAEGGDVAPPAAPSEDAEPPEAPESSAGSKKINLPPRAYSSRHAI